MPTPKFPFIAWDNRLADGIPVASSTASGSARNLADFRPYTSWKPSALPATVTVDCLVARAADYLCIFNHNLFSNGCTIELRGSTDGFVSSDVLVATKTPTSNSPFIYNFTSASYRYWRLTITGSAAPSLSIAAFGVGMEFPTGCPYSQFDVLGRKVFAQNNISEDGEPLGKSIRFEQVPLALSFPHITQAWLRSTFIPAWFAHLRGSPFVLAHDLTNFPDEMLLAQSEGDFRAPLQTPVYATLSFMVKGRIR